MIIISIDIKSTGLQVKVQNLDQKLFIISKTVEDHKLRVFFIVFYRIECFGSVNDMIFFQIIVHPFQNPVALKLKDLLISF